MNKSITVKELKEILNSKDDNLEVHLNYCNDSEYNIDDYGLVFRKPKSKSKKVIYDIDITIGVDKNKVISCEEDKVQLRKISEYVCNLYKPDSYSAYLSRDDRPCNEETIATYEDKNIEVKRVLI